MLISKYFKFSEAFTKCTSKEICQALDISNIFYNITFAMACLDEIRKQFDFPFIVNSWYRDEEHNKRVGGVPISAHKEGLAIDISLRGEQAKKVVNYIKDNIDKLEVDQLIVYPTFIHIAFSQLMPRRQIIYKRSS